MKTNRIGRTTAATVMMLGTLLAPRAMAADATGAAAGTATASVATTAPRRIVVSIPDRKLAVIENDEVVTVLPVAVGKPSTPSPVGTFTIVNRVANPTYHRRDTDTVIPAGPKNPVGTRWIGLSQPHYGIHGTNEPQSIGFAKSHGCIRLRNEDVERLFERVRTGDVVELHAERTPELARLFGETR